MSQFRIQTQAPDGSEPVLLYDNQTSSLTWEDGRPVISVQPRQYGNATVVSVDQPGLKGVIKTLKVSLGLSCNYECSLCVQSNGSFGSSGDMPVIPEPAASAHGAAPNAVLDPARVEEPVSCGQLARDASETTLMVLSFQRWYAEQSKAQALINAP